MCDQNIFELEHFNHEKNDVYELFKNWGLSDEIITILFEHGIDCSLVLEKTEVEDVALFFDKIDPKYFGERIKFKSALREWRKQKGIPFICDADTLSASSRILEWLEKISNDITSVEKSESTICNSAEKIQTNLEPQNLRNLLKSTVRGQMILTFHEKNGFLDSKNQKTLTHCIVERYVSHGTKLTYNDMQKWANVIREVFPKEKSETYYLPRKHSKRNPTGKLYSRWSNAEKENNFCNAAAEKQTSSTELSSEDNEKICWLQYNCAPWHKVLSYWKETFCYRMSNEHGNLAAFLKQWPRYNDQRGYELVEVDFEKMFPGKGKLLFVKIEAFTKKIFTIFKSEIKDPGSKELFLKNLYNENISNDSKYCIITLLLHALLHPQRKNKSVKPTIADSQKDFVTLVATLTDLFWFRNDN